MNNIVSFAPDANPMTPGILVEASGIYPAETGGMRPLPGPNTFTDALPSECLGIFTFRDLGASFRTIAGTATKLYELGITSWTDVSQAGDYSTPRKWRFGAWGNYVLAANWEKKIQVQTAPGALFAEIAAAPVARYLTCAQSFVIGANIGSLYGNRVQWSAQGDHTDWTPSLSTQAGYVDLNDTQGDIRGITKFGNDIIVFKEACFYHGTYVGPPYIWAFRRVPSVSGAIANEGIIEVEGGVYYLGIDDFYFYDGNLPKRVGQGVRQWLLNRLDGNYVRNINHIYDSSRRLIFWFYPTTADGTSKLVEGLIFDYLNGRWGRVVKTIEAGLVHWSANITYDTIDDFFATYNDINVVYDSPWWGANTFKMAYVDSSHKLARLNGTPEPSQFTTGDMGDLTGYSRIFRAWPYFSVEPTTCTISPRTKVKLSDTATVGAAMSLKTDGGVDLDKTAKFHSLQFDCTGDFEIVGYDTQIAKVSTN